MVEHRIRFTCDKYCPQVNLMRQSRPAALQTCGNHFKSKQRIRWLKKTHRTDRDINYHTKKKCGNKLPHKIKHVAHGHRMRRIVRWSIRHQEDRRPRSEKIGFEQRRLKTARATNKHPLGHVIQAATSGKRRQRPTTVNEAGTSHRKQQNAIESPLQDIKPQINRTALRP